MNRWCLKFFLFVCLFIGFDSRCVADELEWQRLACGVYGRDIRCVRVSLDGDIIYIGTSAGLYIKLDGGRCSSLLQPEGQFKGVNAIYISYFDKERILVATDSGLYESKDAGAKWKRIYYSADEDDGRCLSVACLGKSVYLATVGGLFVLDDSANNIWHRLDIAEFYKQAVYHIVSNQDYVYVSGRESLFRIGKDGKATRIFSVGGDDSDDVDIEEDREKEQGYPLIKAIAVKDRYVFIVTSKGIYFSPDDGDRWESIPLSSIPYRQATGIAIDLCRIRFDRHKAYDFRFILATINGVFLYDRNSWIPIYKGLETNKINCVVIGKDHKVYVGTDAGIFYLCLRNSLPSFLNTRNSYKSDCKKREGLYNNKESNLMSANNNVKNDSISTLADNSINEYEDIKDYFNYEPDINKVQELAIEYAEVSPDKIRQWRRKARKKAWLPKVTVSVDGDKNKTVSDSIWGSYTSGGQSYVGPDDKTFYNNFGWDVSLSWDLSDVVWNEDQTSIDTRSKLMVQLREDILDRVTRLYFERRRIQIELLVNRSMDEKTRLDKQLRIEELTAMIDALTGGEFSRWVEYGREKRMRKFNHLHNF